MEQWDIVVVGAGTAGIPCGIAAAELGARVAVLEKDDVVGGTLHLSAGQMSAAGTRRQRAREIEDSPDRHLADIVRIGHGKADPAIARLAVGEAACTLDWLDDLGFPFSDEMPIVYYGHEPYSVARTAWGPELGVSILETIRPRFEELVAAGAIDLRLGHALGELVAEDGRVVGVRAVTPGGSSEIRAAAVVLATGGYASSPELFAELHPGVHCLLGGRETSTGDGLRAARSIGAHVRGADCHLATPGCIETRPGSGRTDIWGAFANLIPQYRPQREIHVNAAGERFLAEDDPSADRRERALAGQNGRFWLVFDEAAIDADAPVVVGWSAEMLREEATKGERAWAAGDVAELARRAGIDADGLVGTVVAYNAAVRDGADRLGRTLLESLIAAPPYYAVAAHAGTVVGFAGLAVDGRLRVLDGEGRPIPGLYAVGEVIGGAATMGDAYCGGMCVTPALSLGRMLGRTLAAAGRAPAGAGR
jgi:fumarate reductase flavoprotein subunit